MENQTPNTSDDDLLKVFDTETTISNVTSIGGAAVTDNLSKILGENNPNNYQEDELLQILNTNSGQWPSHRRSSILKVTEKIAEFRRSSRRVSWAQTYQYKQLQSDGTTGTIHETTMMDMDLDSNDKISKQSAVTNQTDADALAEKEKEENEFLALLKGDAEDLSEIVTDTFEFSFQLPQTNASTAAEIAQMTQGLTSILADVPKHEAAPIETEVSAQSPPKSEAAVVESQSINLPKVSNHSPAPKRPYDFTLLDSDPVVEQQLKFAKQLGASSTATALRTPIAFPSSVLGPISRSRIPVLHGFQQRPAVSASTVILRGLGSAQPKPPQPQQPLHLSENTTTSLSSSSQRTTCVLSNQGPVKVVPTTMVSSAVHQRQIEVDFNQSANRSINNNSRNDSTGMDSPMATRIVESCIHKSIGFGMRNRLIEKARQLNLQREQATMQLTTRTVEVPLEEPPQDTEGSLQLLDSKERFSVKISVSSAAKVKPAVPAPTTELQLNDVQMEVSSEEAANKSIIVNTPNFTMTDMSLDSIKFNDDFDDELDNSDTSSITLLGQQRTSLDLKNLIEEASKSIANVSILSFSDGDTSEKEEELESTLSVTEMPLNKTLGMFLNQSLNLTTNFSDDPFSDSLTAEWLEEYKAETAGNTLYRCISTLDFNSMHIRIHEMNADSCMVRFLWGTLEVRINFGTAKTEGAPRPMTFYNSTQLLTNKPIPYEMMRGLTDLAKYDSDELFMSFDEEHRPFLNLAHNYVNSRFHEEYHELLKKYPDSSKLADLLADLANIVETARNLCVELQHMYEREFMEVMPPEDGCFKFKVKLLGVRLVSHFYLEFAFDSMKYPYEVIRPKIIVPPQDQHFYPIEQFKAALLMVKPGNYNYLKSLVKGAQFFVAALRKVLLRNLMYQKQKAELEGGVLKITI